VLSSVLVLTAECGAYYQTAGTSPEGMACGASPFLIHEIARYLQERHMEVFNPGGAAPDNPGLFRFKGELGAEAVPLECAGYCTGSRLWRSLKNAARGVHERVRGLFRGRQPETGPAQTEVAAETRSPEAHKAGESCAPVA
jgi:hypothetical protein